MLTGIPRLGRARRSGDDRAPRGRGAMTRRSGARDAAPCERALATDAAALPLGHPAPDPELLAVTERVLQALALDLAAVTDALRLLGGGTPLGEEEVGV